MPSRVGKRGMQPKTNHNYLFVVRLGANTNRTQKHTHDVWTSSKFHDHSLVSKGYWAPLSWTSLLSFLNDTCAHTHTHAHAHTECNTSSLQTTLSLGQLASPACCEPGRCFFFFLFFPPFFPRHCFRLTLSVSTAVRLLTQECGQRSGTLFYKAKQCIWDGKCRLLLVLWEKTNCVCVCSCVRVCTICFPMKISDCSSVFFFFFPHFWWRLK